MNAEGYVPLTTVASFKLVQQLTADFAFFVASLRKSKNLIIDDSNTMIKTGFKPARTTLILRDIAPEVSEDVRCESNVNCPFCLCCFFVRLCFNQAICALFKAPVPVGIRPDQGGLWYVQFASEADVIAALDSLTGKTLNDRPVHARIKNETLRYAYVFFQLTCCTYC